MFITIFLVVAMIIVQATLNDDLPTDFLPAVFWIFPLLSLIKFLLTKRLATGTLQFQLDQPPASRPRVVAERGGGRVCRLAV